MNKPSLLTSNTAWKLGLLDLHRSRVWEYIDSILEMEARELCVQA